MIQFTLVILPSSEITAAVENFYHDYSIYRHTTLPPHITLFPPFEVKDISGEKFFNLLTSLPIHPFEITLDKVSNFRNKKNNVIYLSPDDAANQKIYSLIQSIIEVTKPYIETIIEKNKSPFQSHLTLAKHIPQNNFASIFYDARKRFSPVAFECQKLTLFKNSGHGWEKVSDINF